MAQLYAGCVSLITLDPNGWHPVQQIHAKTGKERILKLAITE
jgi:hypothetical protein